jgi:hypothetical protein
MMAWVRLFRLPLPKSAQGGGNNRDDYYDREGGGVLLKTKPIQLDFATFRPGDEEIVNPAGNIFHG